MKTNCLIDWLRFTAPKLTDDVILMPELPVFRLTGEPARPARYYKFAALMKAGRLDWHIDPAAYPHMVTLTGTDMIIVRRHTSERELLAHVCGLNFVNVTRLDFAIDVLDGFSAQRFYEEWERGNLGSRAKKVTRIEAKTEGKSGGVTVYVGSRQSETMLRVYDKGLQTGSDKNWTRVELELKRGVATKVARQMSAIGVASAGKGAIKKFVLERNFPEWSEVLSGSAEVDTSIGRKETNREAWLLRVVYPNFQRALEDGNETALRYLEMWHDEYRRHV